jgi:heme-degrading monooxygenase HmoA
MNIQTITFDVTEQQAHWYVESLRLGFGEFDGLAAHARVRIPSSGRYVIFCTWESRHALRAFRHSETYARFVLSPHVVNLRDRDEIAESVADEARTVAAAA